MEHKLHILSLRSTSLYNHMSDNVQRSRRLLGPSYDAFHQ